MIVFEAVELVFAVKLLFGLLLVAAMVVVDQSGTVTVLDGIGDVAEPVAQDCDGFDGEVFQRR